MTCGSTSTWPRSTPDSIRCVEVWRRSPDTGSSIADAVQFRERAEEARAATNSYLASVIEVAETAEAGRRFGSGEHAKKRKRD